MLYRPAIFLPPQLSPTPQPRSSPSWHSSFANGIVRCEFLFWLMHSSQPSQSQHFRSRENGVLSSPRFNVLVRPENIPHEPPDKSDVLMFKQLANPRLRKSKCSAALRPVRQQAAVLLTTKLPAITGVRLLDRVHDLGRFALYVAVSLIVDTTAMLLNVESL